MANPTFNGVELVYDDMEPKPDTVYFLADGAQDSPLLKRLVAGAREKGFCRGPVSFYRLGAGETEAELVAGL